ncbi:hypothetical protein AgCh_029261 [Apium graveolens]
MKQEKHYVSIEEIANTILENSVEDDLEDDTTPLEPVTRKEALKASKMLNNFLMQHESTTPELLDAIRKIRDELHVDLNYMKNNFGECCVGNDTGDQDNTSNNEEAGVDAEIVRHETVSSLLL